VVSSRLLSATKGPSCHGARPPCSAMKRLTQASNSREHSAANGVARAVGQLVQRSSRAYSVRRRWRPAGCQRPFVVSASAVVVSRVVGPCAVVAAAVSGSGAADDRWLCSLLSRRSYDSRL
jgi:hypothetical protein